jgi:hypothetical protein
VSQTIDPDAQHSSTQLEPDMAYAWAECPLHPTIRPSVIVVRDASPWCIGLPDEINGHAVELKAAAA